ncbi:carboxypeptidase M32 [Shewanella cutis]|uniref:Metal-dependent carboxypeptidase n=1 Tax=Shewanella cutis TaxID=2766780 RepID=A0ABS9QT64_9GAMM|nr:carboxypeptidase M32 [Shewanella sp. PS-2]MCG9962671.1 carboxypeptidase M32 [Shewanella sp. PS-2]
MDTAMNTKQPTPSYDKLTAHFQKISHFEHFSALGDWDQAAMMPLGGGSERGDAMAELALHIHTLKTAPHLGDNLALAAQEVLTSEQHANLREMQYQYRQATLVPGELVQAKTKMAYQCENAWREQRKNNDWQGFKPNLKAIIALAREEALIRAQAQNVSPYDALLDKFEPGMTTAKLEQTFGNLKTWLPTLIQKVLEKQAGEPTLKLNGPFDIKAQQALGLDVMAYLGFDFNHGRLDISSHPFCGGVPSDVRITTRYNQADFSSAIMGIVHETGHARYEQGLPKQWRGQPAGLARSMGVHESQSLFCEMQLGANPAFLRQLQPLINQHLGCEFSAQDLARHYTRVNPGLIRVDADEVTYPCHILLRFEAEKAFIDGSLSVDDLPDFWSSQMQQLLGINTEGNYRDGCMQDIHWAVGELGYFPSYTLGAMYAAQCRFAMERSLGPIENLIDNCQLSQVFNWLGKHIWSKGSLLTTDELIIQATGEPLNGQYLAKHLKQRYLG